MDGIGAQAALQRRQGAGRRYLETRQQAAQNAAGRQREIDHKGGQARREAARMAGRPYIAQALQNRHRATGQQDGADYLGEIARKSLHRTDAPVKSTLPSV